MSRGLAIEHATLDEWHQHSWTFFAFFLIIQFPVHNSTYIQAYVILCNSG